MWGTKRSVLIYWTQQNYFWTSQTYRMRGISENGEIRRKNKLFWKLFYTRNVGYQKKRIDPLNSEKVILAVSDVLHGQKRQNRAENGFSKIGFTICMWGTMRKVMFQWSHIKHYIGISLTFSFTFDVNLMLGWQEISWLSQHVKCTWYKLEKNKVKHELSQSQCLLLMVCQFYATTNLRSCPP